MCLGQFASVASQMVTLALLTRIVAPSVYGSVSLALTAAQFVNICFLAPIGMATSRFYSIAVERGEVPILLSAVLRLARRAVLILVVVALPTVSAIFIAASSVTFRVAVVIPILAAVTGVNSIMDSIQVAARHRATVALHAALGPLLRLGFIMAAAAIVRVDALHVLAAYVAGSLLSIASQRYYLQKQVGRPAKGADPAAVASYSSDLWRYARPFVVWGAPTFCQSISDRWSLQLFCGVSTVGSYQALYQIGYYPLILLSNMLVQFLYPVLYGVAGDATRQDRLNAALRHVISIATAVLCATALVTAGGVVLHRVCVRVLLGPAYRESSMVIPVLIAAGGVFAAGQVVAIALMLRQSSSALIPPKIGTAVLGVAANLAGIRYYGIPGAAGASLMFSASYLIWVTAAARPSLTPVLGGLRTDLLSCLKSSET